MPVSHAAAVAALGAKSLAALRQIWTKASCKHVGGDFGTADDAQGDSVEAPRLQLIETLERRSAAAADRLDQIAQR